MRSPLFVLIVLVQIAGVLWFLCGLMWEAVSCGLKKLRRAVSSGLTAVWRGLLFGGVTLPVAAVTLGIQSIRQAWREILTAAADGTQLVEEEVEDEEEDADQLDKRGGVNKIAQGHARSKAVKATSVAGQRRRAVASARKQHKVFDPGVRW